MPRTARVAPGGVIFHCLNRGNDRRPIFDDAGDYRRLRAGAGRDVGGRSSAVAGLQPDAQPLAPAAVAAARRGTGRVHAAIDDHARAAGVNEPQTNKELEAVRESVHRGRPFGGSDWPARTAEALALQFTFRRRGRPKKTAG